MLSRIKEIESTLSYYPKTKELQNFLDDQILQLACQYLLGDFRAVVSSLELYLNFLHSAFQADKGFLIEIQESLLSILENGKDILHLHEVTEPGTLTPVGHAMRTYQRLADLIVNFSRGKDHSVIKLSLREKMVRLKEILSKPDV